MLYEEDIKDIKVKIINIGDGLVKSNELLLEALKNCDQDKFSEAKTYINNISSKTSDIDNEIVKVLALYSPEARDLREVVSYLKITNELLRASTNTRSFIKGFTDVCSDVNIDVINEYAIPMQRSTTKAIGYAINMLNIECKDEMQDTYNDVLIEENKTDDLYEMVEKSLFASAKESDDFEKFHNMLKALRKSEKIADRATSIANLLLYIKIGGSLHNN
ncbi:MAG: PhoU domain-containing protein [Campylobacterota bacterium]|nr:PhoU domain-containing protein [Campylobacterota bacterium]